MHSVASFFGSLWQALFPGRCIGCGKQAEGICARCIQTLRRAPHTDGKSAFAAFDYGQSLVERAIRDFKYHRRSEAALALARAAAPHLCEFVADALQSISAQEIVLVPIPQYRARAAARGFNQSVLIARTIAPLLEGARVEALLEKIRPTTAQASLKRKTERLENLKHAMRTRADVDPGALYVLIDDVTTTGATFAEARRALLASGARRVLCAALAHGYARA